MFTAGTIYRFGIFVKEAGEQMGRVRVFGVPVLRPFCGTVICLGLRIKDSVLDCPIGKM